MARALGVEASTVLRWESGATRPSSAIAPAYAELLERLATEAGLSALLEVEVAGDGRGT